MRILVTNDDGIHSPGLDALVRIAEKLSDDVWVVAPEFDQSGVSHSLSLSDPLRLRKVDEKRFAVKGTPTDCVIMGVRHVLGDKRPDLVLSGLNRGQNLAEDVIYSGTVAGAMEGTILGIQAIAMSQAYGPNTRDKLSYDTAETLAPDLLRKILAQGLPTGVLLNINFPDCAPEDVKGVSITTQGRRDAELLLVDKRHDGRGFPYYWIGFQRIKRTYADGSDLAAVERKMISVTPLRIDLTDKPFMTKLAAMFDESKLTT
ncbi:MAG: 5'/3'-nucleotidase SurE [Xanthobacteraceae bacterium]|nr:5'/3'-nucleotidase SurE [Xanthobacteraceae bacterium]QYK46310.1 MAG: 5'/3'-nucleotidase SurE [Xanthobacteraceae bacterium]